MTNKDLPPKDDNLAALLEEAVETIEPKRHQITILRGEIKDDMDHYKKQGLKKKPLNEAIKDRERSDAQKQANKETLRDTRDYIKALEDLPLFKSTAKKAA